MTDLQREYRPDVRMIAIDIDGTLLGPDGKVSPRNLAALQAAETAGVEIVIATGRRHCYAMRILRPLGLNGQNVLISSNGTVTRTLGSASDSPVYLPSVPIERTFLSRETSLWLCRHLAEYRNALVLTFDKTGPDGEDARGALVVEQLEELHSSIGKWMEANEPYIAHVVPIEDSLQNEVPIQAMLCGTIERMRRAEACLLEHPGVRASGSASPETVLDGQLSPDPLAIHHLALHRTEYPERDLSILDILPAGCSKGSALLRLAASRGLTAAQTMAIGDNWNDLPMLEVAGYAVLMGNAPEDLKALARQRGWTIAPPNSADGVAETVESALTVASSRI